VLEHLVTCKAPGSIPATITKEKGGTLSGTPPKLGSSTLRSFSILINSLTLLKVKKKRERSKSTCRDQTERYE
jgi:hypothetical protein